LPQVVPHEILDIRVIFNEQDLFHALDEVPEAFGPDQDVSVTRSPTEFPGLDGLALLSAGV
jgi:hypothetical protein